MCNSSQQQKVHFRPELSEMGTTASQLGKDMLSEYQELTFLTKQEILLAYKRFTELLTKDEKDLPNTRVPMERILTLPELKSNPFRKRICNVFSTSEYKDGGLTFEDFLDLLSAFSDSATLEIKSHYAFRIFDFDDDGTLDCRDLEKLVNCLTGETDDTRLTPEEMRQLINNILEESDIDKDGTVNLSEFQHVISRSPDFVRLCCEDLMGCGNGSPFNSHMTECQPPVATQLMGIPQRASTALGSSSGVRPPCPSLPAKSQVYTVPEALRRMACSELRARLLALRSQDSSLSEKARKRVSTCPSPFRQDRENLQSFTLHDGLSQTLVRLHDVLNYDHSTVPQVGYFTEQ
ncbi:hypothetical protein F7725_022689 [Dissostichus mawsoni]|uniref:EF-hand domain-containing protein n=1 Tax=Dissostichus mawsoni TaxID=36200 RepID=A0A7J5YYG0_DISMA|nr:hypothetical protein F7725_022689 [Dissostichus mawsoni]